MVLFSPDVGAKLNQEDAGSAVASATFADAVNFLNLWDGTDDDSLTAGGFGTGGTDKNLQVHHFPETDLYLIAYQSNTSNRTAVIPVSWDGTTFTEGSTELILDTENGTKPNFIIPHPDSATKCVVGWATDKAAVITMDGINVPSKGTTATISMDVTIAVQNMITPLNSGFTKFALFTILAAPTWELIELEAGTTVVTVTSKGTFGTNPTNTPDGWATIAFDSATGNATVVEISYLTDHVDIYPVPFTDSTDTLVRGTRQEIDCDWDITFINATVASWRFPVIRNADGTGAIGVVVEGKDTGSADNLTMKLFTWFWNGSTLTEVCPNVANDQSGRGTMLNIDSGGTLEFSGYEGMFFCGGLAADSNTRSDGSMGALGDKGMSLSSGFVKRYRDAGTEFNLGMRLVMNTDNYNHGIIVWHESTSDFIRYAPITNGE